MRRLGWAFLLGWFLGGHAMRLVIERRLARETDEALRSDAGRAGGWWP